MFTAHPGRLLLTLETLTVMLALRHQVFRSIDTESCVGFPTSNAEAYDHGLISSAKWPQLSNVGVPGVFRASAKYLVLVMLVQCRTGALWTNPSSTRTSTPSARSALPPPAVSRLCRPHRELNAMSTLVYAIQAQHFLYFENQYWLGGSGEWQSLEHENICSNLVPIEIALKVADKILSGEHFATYITIPAFPEGESCEYIGLRGSVQLTRT